MARTAELAKVIPFPRERVEYERRQLAGRPSITVLYRIVERGFYAGRRFIPETTRRLIEASWERKYINEK